MNVKTTRTLGKLITLSLITSTMIHATNGDNLIAVGTKARGMGGVGIAVSHGAESGLGNAALITSVEGTEIGFGGTLFMPDIQTTLNVAPMVPMPPQSTLTSDADMNMIPEVSIAHKINNNWFIGVGMWGTAGMGTDYSKATQNVSPVPLLPTSGQMGNMNMVTNLQLLQFGVPIAYKTGGLSVAVTPIMQYGNLDINFHMPVDQNNSNTMNVGAGLAQDFGFGYNLGMAYDFNNGLTLGATYKSSIEMNYDGQLTTATAAFGGGILPDGDTLEQPAEYGVGLAYITGQHTLAFDYKKIKWSDTKGYGDFGWEDSDVYAFGYAYTENEWTVRLGYNRASSAVVDTLASTMDPRLNFFNLLGFPATSEKHYTVGGSYALTNAFSVDLAYVYSPESSKTFALGGMNGFESISTDHTEKSVSFQLAYKF